MREVLFVESMNPDTKQIEAEFKKIQDELAKMHTKREGLKKEVSELELIKEQEIKKIEDELTKMHTKREGLKKEVSELELTKEQLLRFSEESSQIQNRVTEVTSRPSPMPLDLIVLAPTGETKAQRKHGSRETLVPSPWSNTELPTRHIW